ncbi:hypothetical protein PENTCL1PPCAC_8376 [Pristionchus entomophagus]|uniref:Uncharacterized protein n=1 Tax=Pristionchus entomophagus TaxID=358040 RepID=A0AAV5SS44_9BILA|nr:hypothetical protein PENTCL1PPCAC_8376 [Pristionchus entomophagus]
MLTIAASVDIYLPFSPNLYKCFMDAAVSSAQEDMTYLEDYGHVLGYCLHLYGKSEKRARILKGVAEYCRMVVQDKLWIETPMIWDIVAEVLVNAVLPESGLFEGTHPTLLDFMDAFLEAAEDDRDSYRLFVVVLTRVAVIYHTREPEDYQDLCPWVLDNFESCHEGCKVGIRRQCVCANATRLLMLNTFID